MFLDMEEKISFYKEYIRKESIENGIFLTDNEINKKINEINIAMSLFKQKKVKSGTKFNVEEYNKSLYLIAKDLEIIYKIYYILYEKKLKDLKNYAFTNLKNLEDIVDTFKKQAEYEMNSTTLGFTLLYKNKNFNIVENNSTLIIDLGKINIRENSSVACISNILNISPDNCLFSFENEEKKINIKIPPYNYNNNILKFPGKKNIERYEYVFSENQYLSSPILFDLIDAKCNSNSNFYILAGKNKILTKNSSINLVSIPANNIYKAEEDTDVQFIITSGDKIKFNFNTKPIDCNFSLDSEEIQVLNEMQYFSLKLKKGTIFNFEYNKGTIYAIKEKADVVDSKIYYNSSIEIPHEFLIIEEKENPEIPFNVKLTINNAYEDLDIKDIIIKQLE